MNERNIIKLLKRKAGKSWCRSKVAAIGFNIKNEIIGKVSNQPRFDRKNGSIHAEMKLMRTAGPGLVKILICRVGESGKNFLPIDPCPMCLEKAKELGIKIESIVI